MFDKLKQKMKKGVGLALSGGAVRGVAHIGVLEVLEEEGIPVTAIAGTSAGSLVGALYAAGVPLPEIRKIALETAWKKIFMPTLPKKTRLSRRRKDWTRSSTACVQPEPLTVSG